MRLSPAALALALPLLVALGCNRADPPPNIVLCMTDDQGWGDVGYADHPHLQTPVLDEMAASGLRFDRFYAAAPLCSPTRGSVLTGRHPSRFGCFSFGYSIRPEEVTIAEALKRAGYRTAHFGKWHLGPVRADTPVNPGGSGFDEWLSTDNYFDLNPSIRRNGLEYESFKGDGSDVIVGEALEFIRRAADEDQPFLAVIWFGSVHGPHRGLGAYCEPYEGLPRKDRHYYGEITGIDHAMGTLREELTALGIAEDTLLWFCSDNGPTASGSTGGLRGKKGDLYEGGLRVPAILEWPAVIRQPRVTDLPASTSDIYPTLIDLVGLDVPGQVRPLDGISLRPLIEGRMARRTRPLFFWSYPIAGEKENEPYLDPALLEADHKDLSFHNYRHPRPKTSDFGGRAAVIDDPYKLYVEDEPELYDLVDDPSESRDLAAERPDLVDQMLSSLEAWQATVERSLSGLDYGSGANER